MPEFETPQKKLDWLCTSDGSAQINPGAEWICQALRTEFDEAALDRLVEFSIRGKDLYVLFLMEYHRNVAAMYQALVDGTALASLKTLRASAFYQGTWG